MCVCGSAYFDCRPAALHPTRKLYYLSSITDWPPKQQTHYTVKTLGNSTNSVCFHTLNFTPPADENVAHRTKICHFPPNMYFIFVLIFRLLQQILRATEFSSVPREYLPDCGWW